jgi:23S rRNA (uracil1939-C5)-methyltransferase
MNDLLACGYNSICSGCDWLLLSAETQRRLKTEDFRNAWNRSIETQISDRDIEWRFIAKGGLRDRIDLMIDRRTGVRKTGLFDRFKTGLVDLQGCPQLSTALEKWFQEFRLIDFPIERGSVRLRVAPNGTRGAWLDFANVDVKKLLEEKTVLKSLMKLAIVEIGQKRKRLVVRLDENGNEILKLADAESFNWFETYANEHKIPLYCSIGSFTQPGFRANRVLIEAALELFQDFKSGRSAKVSMRVAEFGSGIGNFTLPLAHAGALIDAYEIDELALTGLKKSLAEQGLESMVSIHSGDFQSSKRAMGLINEQKADQKIDMLFVDPPRSGLKGFLDPIEALVLNDRPSVVLYVSCYTESFVADARRLKQMGYSLSRLIMVDQFPQSRHYEIVSSFVKA